MSERQEVSIAWAVGPAVQKDPILSLGLGRVAGDSVPPVLVSGSLAPQRRRRKYRHRVERGLRAPVENLEGQGSALRAEHPRNDLGETISGLGGIQTLSDGQRCTPKEVLVRQAVVQPQGSDSGLDCQIQEKQKCFDEVLTLRRDGVVPNKPTPAVPDTESRRPPSTVPLVKSENKSMREVGDRGVCAKR
ncbi:hypothetical protein NDU88_005187 [Pleurodeles waltl]|uniref:Uncharacterized protein n=1 Tax=Pleurodeles waltl TaxID=8319 RepID=A0AAV7QHI0_PLEWA|nr:hypothetical protein NDU88_005187 [Pleurodeles waltl]